MKRKFRLFCFALALIFSLALMPATAYVEVIDTRTLAMINKPGTVLVLTTWTADMRLYEFSLDDSLYEDISDVVTRMIKNGEISANDDATIYSVIIQLMAANMYDYAYYNGNVADKKVYTQAMGTGFIVTPDGYLVTNAHVVEDDESYLYQHFAMSNLQAQADADISEMLTEMRRSGYNPSQEELDALYYAYFDLLASSFELSNLQSSFDCVLGNITPGSDVSVKGISMDLRKIGEPYPGKDIAILKIDGQTNLPTVTLGDDTKMKTGDRVYAMGYPGATTLHEAVNLNQSMQEPTLTQGIISARKQMEGGWGIIQMDAAIHYGNSGGPLFNEAGEVIGINTFGSVDDSSGTLVGGMNFAIPISIAKQFLNEINVTPAESTFTTNFKKALSAYNSGNYKIALDLLHGINDTNPGFPVVQELLAEARVQHDANPQPAETPEAIDANSEAVISRTGSKSEDKKGLGALTIILIIAGILVIGAGVAVLLITQKKKKFVSVQYGAEPWQQPTAQPFAAQPIQPAFQAATIQPVLQSAAAAPVCSGCQAQLAYDAKFCDKCGKLAEKPALAECPQCGAQLKPDAKFCSECGSKTDM